MDLPHQEHGNASWDSTYRGKELIQSICSHIYGLTRHGDLQTKILLSRYGSNLDIESPACSRALPRKLDKFDDGTSIFRLDRDLSASCDCLGEFPVELCICGGLDGWKSFSRRGVSIHRGQDTWRSGLATARVRRAETTHRACLQVRYQTQHHRVSSFSSVGPPGSRDGTVSSQIRSNN